MQMEERDRARRALVESFTELTDSDRVREPDRRATPGADQRPDRHASAGRRAAKKRRSNRRCASSPATTRLICSRDAGFNDGHKLEIQAQYEQELAAGLGAAPKKAP